MKALLYFSLVALMGAAASGCSSSRTASSSVEYDDMYHSSSDRTASASASSADYGTSTLPSQNYDATNSAASGDAVANPEYNTGSAAVDQQGNTYVTNNNYDYYYAGNSRRYRSFVSPSYYDTYYTPAWAATPYYGGVGVSYYSGFGYSPYVDPFWCTPVYGPTVSISVGYGFGYSPYYSPFYSPWGAYCSPYAWGGAYGCGYPYAGWRNPYYDSYWHGYNDGLYGNYVSRTPVAYGRRDDRSSTGGRGNTGDGRPANSGGRIMQPEGRPRNSNSAVSAPRPASAAEGAALTPQRPSARPVDGNAAQPRPAGVESTSRPGRVNTPANAQPATPRPSANPEMTPGRPNYAQPEGRPQTAPENAAQPRGNYVAPENIGQPESRPSRAVGGDEAMPAANPESRPAMPEQAAPRPRSGGNDVAAPEQQARPRGLFGGRGNRSEARPAQQAAPARQQAAPAPSRSGGFNGGGFHGGGGGGSMPSAPAGGGGGRPR